MSRYDRLPQVVVTLIVLIVAGSIFASPYIAVRNTKRAAESGDATALARYVDFPAVRESIKSALIAMLREEAGQDADSKLAELGTAVINAIVSPLIDTLVSPEGILALLNGRAPAFDDASSELSDARARVRMRYRGLNQFNVTMLDEDDSSQTITMVFLRRGLSWRMSAILFPEL